MKKLIIAVILIVFAVPVLASEEYKSMCELHPKECEKGSLSKLGETLEQNDGNKYRVIAEAKSTTNPVWIQFVDYCPIGEKLDGKCKFVVFFILKQDGFYGETMSCAEAIAMIIVQCKTEGIKYDDYVHKALDLSK